MNFELEYKLAEVDLDRQLLLLESANELEEMQDYFAEEKIGIFKKIGNGLKELYRKLKEMIQNLFRKVRGKKKIEMPKEEATTLEKGAEKCEKVARDLEAISVDDVHAMKKLEQLNLQLDTVHQSFVHLQKAKKSRKEEIVAGKMMQSGILDKLDRAYQKAADNVADLYNRNDLTDDKYMQKRAKILKRLNTELKFITMRASHYTKKSDIAYSIYNTRKTTNDETMAMLKTISGSAATRADRVDRILKDAKKAGKYAEKQIEKFGYDDDDDDF